MSNLVKVYQLVYRHYTPWDAWDELLGIYSTEEKALNELIRFIDWEMSKGRKWNEYPGKLHYHAMNGDDSVFIKEFELDKPWE